MKAMISDKIKKWAQDVLGAEGDFVVEYPAQISHGDYSINVALIESKKQNKNPKKLAEEFVQILNDKKIEEIEKIEIAGPGFINFFLKPEVFTGVVRSSINESNTFGKNKNLEGQTILIEHTDPNPFKEFHIGHLMSNAIGESISRIIENEGANVKRISYGSDMGLHVAKGMYGILNKKDEIDEIKSSDKKEQLSFWASGYVFGNSKYEEDENIKEEIDQLNKIIFDKKDKETNALYEWGREVSIHHFQEIFTRLGTKFDKNIWESELVEGAKVAVKEGLNKNILEESEGAIIFRGEKYGLHTRVFVNSKGIPVYEAKELALGIEKYETFSFDKSIIITGNEQNDYFKVVLQSMELLRPEVKNKTVHIGHGMLRFSDGKMSSRKGNVITGEIMLDKIKNIVLGKMKDREIDGNRKDEIAEKISIGALKYSILKQASGRDIIFDFEKSVSFEGDSGPYLQYAVVRANSILRRAQSSTSNFKFSIPDNWQTTNLERLIERFESVACRSGEEYAPHHIVTYLIQLAGEFNSFYAKHKIIDENDVTSPYKLALTQSFVNVMTNGLNLLGISVPEEM